MAKFYSLFSSSDGNASCVLCGGSGLLVDVGVSCKKMVERLQGLDIDLSKIRGILITHSHSDHIKGLAPFLKKHPMPVYATAETLDALKEKLPPKTECHAFLPDDTFQVGNIAVEAFPTMHDVVGSCGFQMRMPDGQTCAICTDLGCVTPEVEAGVTGSDLVLLEANYDPGMLQNGPYPVVVQQRIASEYGHLSNAASADFAAKLVKNGTTRLVLGHLSPQNNTQELARQEALQTLMEHQMRQDQDFLLHIARPAGLEEAVIF